MKKYTVQELSAALRQKLRQNFGTEPQDATPARVFKASALVLRDILAERESKEHESETKKRQVHYLSMEFLIGRSLLKNAQNLGLSEELTKSLETLGFNATDVFETEPAAGLGNGGLGRLRNDPNAAFLPRTFLFGTKAAPGYTVAKRIIMLINSLARQISNDPICRGQLSVVFLENYRVSLWPRLLFPPQRCLNRFQPPARRRRARAT